MATRQALTRPTISICLPLFFFIIMLATGATAALAYPPSVLQLYKHEDQISENKTTFVVVDPGGKFDLLQTSFGTVAIFDNVVREGAALDSPVLGRAPGNAFVMKEPGNLYLSYSYVLDTPGLNGTITAEGQLTNGVGQLAITGGTGDFLSASGYVEQTINVTSFTNRQFLVYNNTLYLNYAYDESSLFLKK